ncbi:MAG: MlaD family protein [Chitinophagaceae bacterium]|nr:MlaD family protein [Chitinophagaceae bacterium]
MNVSNETKVGALTVIAVTMLVLGYNMLKGKNLIKRSDVVYARFNDVGALEISSPVKIKGYRIGNVYSIGSADENVSQVIVAINLDKKVNIPVNSLAAINNSITGSSSLNITPGDATAYIKEGDTLKSSNSPDLMAKLSNSIDPALTNIKQAVDSLKLVLGNLNSVFDEGNKANLKAVIANLKNTSANLNVLLNSKDGALAKTLNNAETFTSNLNKNNENLNKTIENFKNTSQKLSELQFKETLTGLNNTVAQLQGVIEKINKGEGSLGMLLKDPKLYNSLQNTVRSVNVLIDDLKTHPKRYVSFSVFGKKDKGQPLMAPLADSITNKQ